MAVITIPTGCYAQPDDEESSRRDEGATFSVRIKGPIATLQTTKSGIEYGVDTFEGHLIVGASLRRVAGDYGVLTLDTTDAENAGEEGASQKAYKGVWTMHAVRADRHLLAMCKNATERVNIELWQKESDRDLAVAYKYKKADGTVVELSDDEKKIAKKLAEGRTTIIRYQPYLTFTAYYRTCPTTWGVGIGFIDTPDSVDADKIIAPSNIQSVLSDFEFLKVQDDIEEQPDGGFKRTLSWWGIADEDGGWDHDFYSPTNHWTFPQPEEEESQGGGSST